MANVKIICPTCTKSGIIEVSLEVLKGVSRGLLAINIAGETICEHSFIVYVDKNLEVRDYFVADFHIEIPDLPTAVTKKFQEKKLPSKDILDIDLIKLNMPATLLTYLLKSIFSKQKIVLISEYEFLHNHIHNFFDYVAHDTFDIDITMMTEAGYNGNKKQYKDYMVLKGNNIIKNAKKIINPKKLEIEKQIISKFMTEHELGYSYILLKNEIQKAFELTKAIVGFVEEKAKSKEKVNILEASTNLEHKYSIKINPIYLSFLNEIVRNYYGIIVPSASQSFLGSL